MGLLRSQQSDTPPLNDSLACWCRKSLKNCPRHVDEGPGHQRASWSGACEPKSTVAADPMLLLQPKLSSNGISLKTCQRQELVSVVLQLQQGPDLRRRRDSWGASVCRFSSSKFARMSPMAQFLGILACNREDALGARSNVLRTKWKA